jgi:hypothetical protein
MGSLLDKWAVLFLRCNLAASVTWLLLPFHHFEPMHWVSMLSVYLSGAVILAWHKYHLTGVWRSIFAMATTIVLYLNVLVAIALVFKQISPVNVMVPAQSALAFLVMQLAVMVVFVVLGAGAVKRFHVKPTHSL